MKRFVSLVISLFLALTMCFALVACKSEAAKNADALISEIGKVTLNSESKIIAAEEVVMALDEKDKGQIEYEQVLIDARAQYDDLVKDKEAREVSDAIASIGTVTTNSETAITTARKLYNSKESDVQKRVSNYSDLEAAEESLNVLKATEVTALIDKIGTVTLESKEIISTAQNAYNSLSAAAKDKVENTDILEAAVQALNALEAEAKEKEKEAVLSQLTSKTDEVEGITWYQSKKQPKYINTRSYVLPYIGQNSSSTWLRLKCNYTGDDWVFFEKIIFVVDGEKYTKYFNYRDIHRDNDAGDVWEVADFAPDNSDIKMLEAIANSTETIIRFEGDDRRFDMTVKSDDKQGIKDVLTAYEFLK